MADDILVSVIPITSDNASSLARVALAMYLGEICYYCGQEMNTMAEPEDSYCAAKENGRVRIAHEACYLNAQSNS